MPVICWGPLAKSAQDSTTIPEYIAGKISEHNADPSAHGLDSYAIYNHRVADVLDHADNSVILQKLLFNRFIIQTQFETIDSWSKYGNIWLQGISQVEIAAYSPSYIRSQMAIVADDANDEGANIDHSPEFQTTVKFSDNGPGVSYFVSGDVEGGTFWGFMFADGQLNAVHTSEDCDIYIYPLYTPNIWDWHVFRAAVDSERNIRYYIDHNLYYVVKSQMSNFGVGAFITYYVLNSSPSCRGLYIQDLLYQEDNFP